MVSGSAGMSDWTTEATDAIERAVVTVRDRTVTPAKAVTRVVVYSLLAALFAVPALVMLAVGFFRGLVEVYQGEVWAAWLTLGAISVLAGMFCWAKRTAKRTA
jgi:ABC-type Fe3+-hydroxamate transport system substrate-binding protein